MRDFLARVSRPGPFDGCSPLDVGITALYQLIEHVGTIFFLQGLYQSFALFFFSYMDNNVVTVGSNKGTKSLDEGQKKIVFCINIFQRMLSESLLETHQTSQ